VTISLDSREAAGFDAEQVIQWFPLVDGLFGDAGKEDLNRFTRTEAVSWWSHIRTVGDLPS
jgi:hypothetical protein